jgi:hypothetical protein
MAFPTARLLECCPMRRWTPLLAVAVASCSTASVPRLRFPQVEQAQEAVQGGGERYRAHQACAPDARSVDQLITCMRAAGWDFVERRPGYPEADCWQDRDRGEVGRIVPQCFVHIAGQRGSGPSP